MRILYLSTHCNRKGSSAAIRNSALIGGLMELGHSVDVVTLKNNDYLVSPFLRETKCSNLIEVETKVMNFLGKGSHGNDSGKKSFISRIKKEIRDIVFFPDVFKEWGRSLDYSKFGGYDIVISSSDSKSSHLPAERIKKEYPKIRWIQIWGDPWCLDMHLGFIPSLMAKRKEKLLMSEGDKIVFVSDITCQAMKKRYNAYANKFYYVPRSFYKVIKKSSELNDGVIRVLYPGALSKGRDIGPFLKQVDDYNSINSGRITISFYGGYDSETHSLLNKYDFVDTHDSVDFDVILGLFASFDALLFISNGKGSTQIPGKLYDFMGTELPIICILSESEKQLGELLQQYQKCLIFNNVNQIVNKIKQNVFPPVLSFSPEITASKIIE